MNSHYITMTIKEWESIEEAFAEQINTGDVWTKWQRSTPNHITVYADQPTRNRMWNMTDTCRFDS